MDIIEENLDLNWDWMGITYNPNLTINFIKKYQDKFKNHWSGISQNENIHMEDIENNLDLDWDFEYISTNPNLTINFIKKYKDKMNWYFVSGNKNMTLDIIELNLDLLWDFSGISYNSNLTINLIKKYPDQIWWDWDKISANSNITMNDIEENPEYPWNYELISENPNLTEDFISKHLGDNWNWLSISENPNITFDIVQRNLNWPWNWSILSRNPNITCDIIESNFDSSLDWNGISENENLTEEFITARVATHRKNISKLDLKFISFNLFTNKLNLLEKEYDKLLKLLCKEFFYQVSMHNPETKGYYYKKDMKILIGPNILNYIENFEKKYNIVFDTKIKNYLFDQIFEIQIEKKFFVFEDKDIFKILLNIYFKYGNILTDDERNYFSSKLIDLIFEK